MEILEELLPAKNQTLFLARKLGIPDHTVETIHKEQTDQKERLYRVIQEFLKRVEPSPTWRVILDALRSSIVNLPRLAKEIERRHGFHTPASEPTSLLSSVSTASISSSTATAVVPYSVPDATADSLSLVPATQASVLSSVSTDLSPSTATAVVPYSAPDAAADSLSLVPATQVSGYKFTLAELEAKIDELEGKFDELRTDTLKALQWNNVNVNAVVYQLTTLKAREISEHKVFLKENLKMLKKHDDLVELFEDLNFYWNYLSPGLLEHLAKQFRLKTEVQSYKGDLEDFRAKTSLKLFCLIEVKYIGPTEEFCNLVANFKVHLSRDMTLQDVEDFRRRYASHYSLYDFTLRLNSILPGSFIVSFLVPESIVEILRVNIPEEMLKVFGVTRLEIAGSCVYSDIESVFCPRPRSMSAPVISHSSLISAKDRKLAQTQQQLSEKEILLIRKTAELIKAEKTIRREQQQLREKEEQLRSTEGENQRLRKILQNILMKKELQMLQTQSIKQEFQSPKSKTAEVKLQETFPLESFGSSKPSSVTFPLESFEPSSVTFPPGSFYYGQEVLPSLKQLTVQCHPRKKAPYGMIRGSATSDQQYAYFTSDNSTSVYSYEWNTEQWEELPPCPYRNSALVIIDSELTTVGGENGSGCMNTLFTLRQGQWVEEYPPMKTARSRHAAVSTPDGGYITVIGGWRRGGWTATVELFQVKTRQWYELPNLPKPFLHSSATICGNKLHVIYAYDGYSCSLQALPSSDKPITPQSIPHLISWTLISWTPLPRLPAICSTAASLFEQLVIIGGSQDGPPVNSIHQLVEGQWVEISNMASGRMWCLSVSPSPDRVMIVGGVGAKDSVEEISV